MKHVGFRHRPIDWDERSSGRVVYTGDVALEGILEGAILRSPHPYAEILAIDVADALSAPGVRAIITASDLPAGARYHHEGERDRAPLADGVVRFLGQEVAAVAADTREQAQDAIRRIKVLYRPLEAPMNVAAALGGSLVSLHARPTGIANVSRRVVREWGDLAAGLARSAVKVGGRFRVQRQAHACMETLITLAHWRESEQRLHVWTSTQAPYYIVKEVSQVLGLMRDQVVCHEVGVGGGFGAKSKICDIETLAAALSRASGSPVRIRLAREEEFETTKSRHAFDTRLTLHADAEGVIHAIEGDIDVENGAFNHSGASVMGAGIKGLGMMYRPEGLRVVGQLVDTALTPGGQFRGYGTTQTSFAMESLVDQLAGTLNIDAVDLRMRNANLPGDVTLVGAKLRTAGLRACLTKARAEIGWDHEKKNRRPGRGVGFAAGVHTSGSFTEPGANRSDAIIDILPGCRVRVRFGGADAGTGQRTIMAQVAADELCVPYENVDVLTMDSDRTPFDMGSWSSRGTHFAAHAVRTCARETSARLRALAATKLGDGALRLEAGQIVNEAGEAISLAEAARLSNEAVDGVLSIETSYVDPHMEMADRATGKGNVSASYNFAAHAAIVDVDRRTGAVKVLDYVAVHDVGQPINPTLVEGQTIGGVAMGIGLALGEDLIFEQGKLVNPSYINYAMLRAADLPRIRPYLVGEADPNGPYGAKAIGECSINPPPATIANAVFDAIGVRITDLPITPDKIVNALAARDGRQRRHRIWMRPSRWWIAFIRALYARGLLRILHSFNTTTTAVVDPSPVSDVRKPRTLADAVAALADGAVALGGGTDLHLQRRMRLVAPEQLAAVRTLADLRIWREDDSGIEIGASRTLAELEQRLQSRAPVLAQAAASIATPQIRSMATLAGNLVQSKRCWFYRSGFQCYKRKGGLAPCYAIEGDHRFHHAVIDGHRCQATTPSDLATALAALDATIVVAGPAGERMIPIAAFYTGPGETSLAPDELVKSVRIPASALARSSAFAKLRLWEGDFAIVSAAITANIDEEGIWRKPQIVLGGLAPVPWRAVATGRSLDGQRVTPALLVAELNRELDAHAHPLRRNAWKLDAAAGVAEQAFELIEAQQHQSLAEAAE